MSTLRTNTLQNAAGTASVPVDTVVSGSAKAWVNFNGTGTVAIRAAFNVSSITDNGTGDYTVNFTTAMVDANYAAVISARQSGVVSLAAPAYDVTGSATALRVPAYNAAGSNTDMTYMLVAIFR